MKKVVIMLALIVALALPVFAQEFPDVPSDHWAYQAVNELLNAGIVIGYPDGTYGGKRAMTRYEFAEAIARAIPFIEQKAKEGMPGATAANAPDLSNYVTKDQIANFVTKDQLAALQKLIDEFRDELAALGVDVEALRRDVAALNERVTALEEEVARVRFTGEADVIGRGGITNSGPAADIDGRLLQVIPTSDLNNPLANSSVFENLDFGMKAKAGPGAVVNAQIMAGNYMPWALEPGEYYGYMGTTEARVTSSSSDAFYNDFILWNMNANVGLKMGPLGSAQIVAGRQNLQLTPLTLKFVDPDYYNDVTVLDSGDFVVDGGKATFNFGKASLTAFGAKTGVIGGLQMPTLSATGGQFDISQIGGVRVVIGGLLSGNLGLTWYEAGSSLGAPKRETIWGADYNGSWGNIGLGAEYAKTDPNDALPAAWGDDNVAYNAKLSYKTGSFGFGAGYNVVEAYYNAPGSWMRAGRLVNLQNTKGFNADASYQSGNFNLTAKGQRLTPENNALNVSGRQAAFEDVFSVPANRIDNLTNYKVDLGYNISSAMSLNLGWEQSTLEPTSGDDVTERYLTAGLGHSFNPNSKMKVFYQVAQVDDAAALSLPDYRGGLVGAQFQLKY